MILERNRTLAAKNGCHARKSQKPHHLVSDRSMNTSSQRLRRLILLVLFPHSRYEIVFWVKAGPDTSDHLDSNNSPHIDSISCSKPPRFETQ